MKQITIIVPLHVYDETNLNDALNSVDKSFNKDNAILLFVGPKDVCDKASKLYKGNIKKIILENDETDFNTQINKAVFKCTTQYFTILEFDDGFTEYYNEIMQRYIEKHPDLSIILPIVEYYDTDAKFMGFGNEIVWNPGFASVDEETFTDNLGVIDSKMLDTYMDFNCTGGLFKTEDFISVGGLKTSMKIASWYEFLLRAVNVGKEAYVIPRVCYSHLLGRPESYSEIMHKEIGKEEGRWLIDYAKTDYVNLSDSNLKYEETKE